MRGKIRLYSAEFTLALGCPLNCHYCPQGKLYRRSRIECPPGGDVLQRWHPKLAICLYHRLQDFWQIPMYVKKIVPDYKLYIRHHQEDLGGTVLYAVLSVEKTSIFDV